MATTTPDIARPAAFPHHYELGLDWLPGAPARLHADQRPELPGGAPPEFGGRDDCWSPEHLLLGSLALCLQTTFEALARKAGLAVQGYKSRAAALLDKTREGLSFTAFVVNVSVQVGRDDVERARLLAEKAEVLCLVSNALRTPVRVQISVLQAV